VHTDRSVKDLTAHLFHGSLRRVSSLRDRYCPPAPRLSGVEEITAFIQQDNREFMTGMRRVSPQVLIELIELYDREVLRLFAALEPDAPGLGVAWAGETVSCNWFDIAREYTEKWHHQQQLRDATGQPPLYAAELLVPALETFARGLPFAYRDLEAGTRTRVAISTTGAAAVGWTLRHDGESWSLWSGADPAATTAIRIPADVAWRVWTRGESPDRARGHVEVTGDGKSVAPLLRFVAIMA